MTGWTIKVPLYRLSQWTNDNLAFGHIVCQPIRSLQVGPDLPNTPHVSVKPMYDFRPGGFLLLHTLCQYFYTQKNINVMLWLNFFRSK